MSTEKDLAILTTDCGYNAVAKKQFHATAKRYLKRLAAALALPAGSFDLRSNHGGIAVSGEVTLHGEHLYVQVSQFSIGPLERVVLFRGCHGRQDYSGMENHYATAEDLIATAPLTKRCGLVAENAELCAAERMAA